MAAQSPITIEELAEKAGLSLECLDLPFHKNHAHILAKFCDPWENIGYHLGLDDVVINQGRVQDLRKVGAEPDARGARAQKF